MEARPTGYGNRIFWVSRRAPNDIVVLLKIHLDTSDEIRRLVTGMEDAIEKRVQIPGFTVDLRFVGKPSLLAFDVVTVKADPNKWTTSLNWAGSFENVGHGLMHVLGLEDEYDLIESHAGNHNMPVTSRLHWFEAQMGRPTPPRASWARAARRCLASRAPSPASSRRRASRRKAASPCGASSISRAGKRCAAPPRARRGARHQQGHALTRPRAVRSYGGPSQESRGCDCSGLQC